MHAPSFKALLAALGALSATALAPTAQPVAAQQPAMVPPLEYYGDLPAVEDAILSPSGAYTALLMTVRGERAILVIDAAGAPVKQLVVGDAKVRGIYWAGEEAILLLRSETGRLPTQYLRSRAEFLRGNVIPLSDAIPVVSIFANQTSIANAIAGFHGIRRVDGRWKGFFEGFRRGATSGDRDRLLDDAPALFEVDLLTGDADLADYAPDRPIVRDWLVTKEGEIGARLDLDIRRGDWSIRNAAGKTVARGRDAAGRVGLRGFAGDGAGIVYWTQDEGADRTQYRIADEAGEANPVPWGDQRVSDSIIDPMSGIVLGIRGTDGEFRLSDAGAQENLQKVYDSFRRRKNLDVDIADLTSDLSTLIVSTSGAYDSGTWFRVDTASGARAIVGLERPAIQGQAIGPVSRFEYTASDGLAMDGVLTLPPDRAPTNLPVVILPHGGPAAHDEVRFDWWAQGFASRGYAVFQPNFRGSTGRGPAFEAAGEGEWGRKMQSDKSDGLMALAEAGIVDPQRACIVGASYGGYAALAGVTMQQGIYRCAVSVNGVSDIEKQMAFTTPVSGNILWRYMRRAFGKGTDLDAISPTSHARDADAPVLLIHGKDDTVVPYAQSVLMHDALKSAGKTVEMVTLEGEDHWLSQGPTRKRMLEAAVRWVEAHNPPG